MSDTETEITEAIERLKAYRKHWTVRGEWDREPDRETFEHAGLPCVIQRGPAGAWCGYVAVPPSHPWHRKGYSGDYGEDGGYTPSPVDVEVHGGLTYADACQGGVCHIPKPGEPDNVWWFGFDCNHLGDLAPKSLSFDQQFGFGRDFCASYKTISYARAETMSLAKQLAAVAK